MEAIETSIRRASVVGAPLFAAGDRVLVAVSGGPDSICLLHVLLWLRDAIGLEAVEAAYLDHQLRGRQSADDGAFVAGFCAERAVPCRIGAADVARRVAEEHLSVQEAARKERYAFLERTAAERGLNKIAMGHTRDDQIETVLLNLFRGSGLDGLRGMTASNGLYVRPLLEIGRPAVEEYCARHGLIPRHDPSNDDPEHYTRNRIRLEVLPAVVRSQPQAGNAVLRLSRMAALTADYVHQQASAALECATVSKTPAVLSLDSVRLADFHPALQSATVRLAIEQVRGGLADITDAHVRTILGFLSRETRGGVTTPFPTIYVTGDCRRIRFERAAARRDVEMEAIPLPAGGRVSDPEGLWWVGFGDIPGHVISQPGNAGSVYSTAVDPRRLAGELIVRGRKPGDRIDPLGMGGHHRKLQDIFVDARIPSSRRGSYPIVCDDLGPVWIPGLAQSSRVTATNSRGNSTPIEAFVDFRLQSDGAFASRAT